MSWQGTGTRAGLRYDRVLLHDSSATIDISRYMRYMQVTTFVSQQTASQIYRQCSDITIYNKPYQGSAELSVDTVNTTNAISQCIQRIQAASQLVLNKSLGNSAISSNVFRWNISNPTTDNNCASLTASLVTQIGVAASTTPDLCNNNTNGSSCPEGVNRNPILVNSSGTTASTTLSEDVKTSIQTSDIKFLLSKGIYRALDNQSLVSTANLCNRGRVVTVEVAYAFSPIVKFLPNITTSLDTTGRRREISIF